MVHFPQRSAFILYFAQLVMWLVSDETYLNEQNSFWSCILHIVSLIMAYLTFRKWLVSACNIHSDIWMVQTKTSHLGKVSYAIILLGWRYVWWLLSLMIHMVIHRNIPLEGIHCAKYMSFFYECLVTSRSLLTNLYSF